MPVGQHQRAHLSARFDQDASGNKTADQNASSLKTFFGTPPSRCSLRSRSRALLAPEQRERARAVPVPLLALQPLRRLAAVAPSSHLQILRGSRNSSSSAAHTFRPTLLPKWTHRPLHSISLSSRTLRFWQPLGSRVRSDTVLVHSPPLARFTFLYA